jgi:hypothetical protein
VTGDRGSTDVAGGAFERTESGGLRALLIAYHFPPTGGGGVQRALAMAKYLPAAGVEPTVVTGPRLAEDRWAPEDDTLVAEIPTGLSVHRVASEPPSPGKWGQRLERWGIRESAFARWWVDSVGSLGATVAPGHDVILATMSPFASGEAARQLSERTTIPWIADLRDPWALDEMQVYPTRLHRRRERARMERLLASAAMVVMNTPEAARAVREELPGIADTPVVTVTNGFDRSQFEAPLSARPQRRFRIVHSGSLHSDAGIRLSQRLLGGARADVDILTRSHDRLLRAIEQWFVIRPEVADRVELLLVGDATDEDRAVVAASPAASIVRFVGYVSHSESIRLLREADLLFLPMQNLPPGERSRIVPGKTYEYLASGRPILGAVPDGDTRDFLAASGAARLCRPDDVGGMTTILDEVFLAWRSGGTKERKDEAFLARFERRTLSNQIADALRSVVVAHPVPRAVTPPPARGTVCAGSSPAQRRDSGQVPKLRIP